MIGYGFLATFWLFSRRQKSFRRPFRLSGNAVKSIQFTTTTWRTSSWAGGQSPALSVISAMTLKLRQESQNPKPIRNCRNSHADEECRQPNLTLFCRTNTGFPHPHGVDLSAKTTQDIPKNLDRCSKQSSARRSAPTNILTKFLQSHACWTQCKSMSFSAGHKSKFLCIFSKWKDCRQDSRAQKIRENFARVWSNSVLMPVFFMLTEFIAYFISSFDWGIFRISLWNAGLLGSEIKFTHRHFLLVRSQVTTFFYSWILWHFSEFFRLFSGLKNQGGTVGYKYKLSLKSAGVTRGVHFSYWKYLAAPGIGSVQLEHPGDQEVLHFTLTTRGPPTEREELRGHFWSFKIHRRLFSFHRKRHLVSAGHQNCSLPHTLISRVFLDNSLR